MKLRVNRITNQRGATATLLRTSWREGKRVRHRTVANLSRMSPEIIEGFRIVLKGGVAVTDLSEAMEITRTLPHGHVAAALWTARVVGLERVLHRRSGRERDLALAATGERAPCAPDQPIRRRLLGKGSLEMAAGFLLPTLSRQSGSPCTKQSGKERVRRTGPNQETAP